MLVKTEGYEIVMWERLFDVIKLTIVCHWDRKT